ncbi:fumarylacetoacetate hydrolase family protein [uncultured Ferrimonas sp.]|uniref:fumarylacetoacetate hydrolase family protein n=1 Tax=uncultured Ferrimonas sp. TaxID=432640 RepID=UPI002620C33E|nr:fumarylacetoacetate hydrolase family protein [uncultured Ferrimonas sp.]
MTIQFQQHSIKPEKILCVGRNFVDHINELGNAVADQMVLFIKPGSAIGTTLRAQQQEPLHFEAELSFLVQEGQYVAVAVGLDLTKRRLQNQLKQQQLPWERAKAFAGSALFTDLVPLPQDLDQLKFELHINDQLVQSGQPALMIHSLAAILTEVKHALPLANNDIIMTGTPAGVGQINTGSPFTLSLWHQQQLLTQSSWIAQ